MRSLVFAALAAAAGLLLAPQPTQARPHAHWAPTAFCGDRYCPVFSHIESPRPKFSRQAKSPRKAKAKAKAKALRWSEKRPPPAGSTITVKLRPAKKLKRVRARVVGHPAGCPSRRFCGCGVSAKVFGKPVRSLYLAANWRRFKPAAPAPGMVAWRWGHVFYILAVRERGRVLAYDPNSGGGLTRIHLRRLAGYRVVNPRAPARAVKLAARSP